MLKFNKNDMLGLMFAVLPLFLPQLARAVVAPRLDFLVVSVNGERKVVRDGDTLKVVRGDAVQIDRATLAREGGDAATVNLVGYSRPRDTLKTRRSKQEDDRGALVDTGSDLKKKFSQGGKGDQYVMLAETTEGPIGSVTLQLIDPEFLYAEVFVNGKMTVARVGETLKVQPEDRVRVSRVVTNVSDDRTVRFQIDSSSGQSEIQLFRGTNVFARIPLSASLLPAP